MFEYDKVCNIEQINNWGTAQPPPALPTEEGGLQGCACDGFDFGTILIPKPDRFPNLSGLRADKPLLAPVAPVPAYRQN
jgi:hypothetical protein